MRILHPRKLLAWAEQRWAITRGGEAPLVYTIFAFLFSNIRNSQLGSHIRILMAGCSPPLPAACYGLNWGHTVIFKRKTRSYLAQWVISLFLTGIYVSLAHITIYRHLRLSLLIVFQVYPQWRAMLLQGALVVRTHDRPKIPYTPFHTMIGPDHFDIYFFLGCLPVLKCLLLTVGLLCGDEFRKNTFHLKTELRLR